MSHLPPLPSEVHLEPQRPARVAQRSRVWFLRTTLLLWMVFLLSACGALQDNVELLPTATATEMPTATATIIWFPPTPTRRPIQSPTAMPTVDYRPGLGEVIFADDFSSKAGWQTLRNDFGSVAFGKDELTLAMGSLKGSLSSLATTRQLSDFYLDVTLNTSLCRAGDVYGLLVRAAGAQDFYRILASCDGLLRAERVSNGKVAILQDWTPSGQLRPGAPQYFRLGVWAFQSELRIFIDDIFQFSVSDRIHRAGILGVFARTPGSGALTVSFSDLKVRALSGVAASPTPQPASPTAPGARLTATTRP